jgi:purine-binding chemotaxis protein CheW
MMTNQALAKNDLMAPQQLMMRPAVNGTVHTAEQKQHILKARAQALAQGVEKQEPFAARLEVIEFLSTGTKYAVPASAAREVYPVKDLTPLPGAPPFMLGIINVRGLILPIIDLARIFNPSEKKANAYRNTIIVYADNLEAGIAAETILALQQLPLSTIQPPLPTLTGAHTQYLRGFTAEGTMVIDVQKLLSGTRLSTQE